MMMPGIKGGIAAIGAILGWFFGGWDSLLYLLVTFVVIDYLSGLFAAAYLGEVSSKRGLKGIMKKVLIFLLVGVGNAVDRVLLPDGDPVRTAVIFFYLSNEGISILENMGSMGMPVPGRLKKVLVKLKEEQDEDA